MSYGAKHVAGNPGSGSKYTSHVFRGDNIYCFLDIAVGPHPAPLLGASSTSAPEARSAAAKRPGDAVDEATTATPPPQQQSEEGASAGSQNKNKSSAAVTSEAETVMSRVSPALTQRTMPEPLARFRLVLELFASESPHTVENFRKLCTGEVAGMNLPSANVTSQAALEELTMKKPPITMHYKGTTFHKLTTNFVAQGGDVAHCNGKAGNYWSTFGNRPFQDENLKRRHAGPGCLSMANCGPNTNGSQFFITLPKDPAVRRPSDFSYLDGKHCCFGRVLEGLEEFGQWAKGDQCGVPQCRMVVEDCGQLDEQTAPSK